MGYSPEQEWLQRCDGMSYQEAVETAQDNPVDGIVDSILRAKEEAQTKGAEPTVEEQQAANWQALDETLKEMFGPETAVDTQAQAGYDGINEKGAKNDGKAGNDYGGIQRDSEIHSQVQTAGSAENGGGDVQSGNPIRDAEGVRRGALHSADNGGRRVTPQQAEKLQESAVVDKNGTPIAMYGTCKISGSECHIHGSRVRRSAGSPLTKSWRLSIVP